MSPKSESETPTDNRSVTRRVWRRSSEPRYRLILSVMKDYGEKTHPPEKTDIPPTCGAGCTGPRQSSSPNSLTGRCLWRREEIAGRHMSRILPWIDATKYNSKVNDSCRPDTRVFIVEFNCVALAFWKSKGQRPRVGRSEVQEWNSVTKFIRITFASLKVA